MSAWRRIAVRLRALVHRRAADAELDEELQYHLEREVSRRVAAGEPPDEARFAARRQFGNPTVLAEEARESWQIGWVELLAQDVRYALRGFARARGFVVTVVLTIGLGLGLLTAAFTIFDSYVLRPNAVRDPHELYEVWFLDREGHSRAFSWDEYQAMRDQNPALDDVAAFLWLDSRLDGEPIVFQGVSGNYFSALGVTPALGRVLLPGDAAAPGGERVVVLSHQAWLARFGADSAIVGKTLRLNGRSLEVVGVARRGFDGLSGLSPDFWMPITAADPSVFATPQPRVLGVIGRLKTGVGREAARTALTGWGAALTRDHAEAERVAGVRILSSATPVPMVPLLVQIVLPIAVAFVLVLLIACANIANVMLARGLARRREIGVRLALGAARRRLVRQLLTESVLLALPAAVVAFVLSRVALRLGVWAMLASVPPGFAKWFRVLPLTPDLRVFIILVAAALVSALAFGLAPALHATRASVVQATRGDFGGARPSRLRGLLVGLQVTVAVLLLVSAGVLLRGSRRLGALDPGLRTAGVVQVDVADSARTSALEVLHTHPDVVGVATSLHPAIDGGTLPQAEATGYPGARTVVTYVNEVSQSFVEEMGVEVRRGRTFTEEEARGGADVALVSEAAVRRFWPGRNAIGTTLSLTTSDSTPPRDVQVIGVVEDLVPGALYVGADVPLVLLPRAVEQPGVILAHVRGDAGRAMVAIERALDARAPGALKDIHTIGDAVAMQAYPLRFGHWLASLIGLIALVLTATGIYGVVSYLVAQRTREMGIRIALGASRTRVVLLVARDLLRLTGMGIVVGAALALGVSALFASQIVAFDVFDVVAYAGGIAVAIAACAAAAFVPSRRVAKVDPVIALRSE